MSPLFVPDDSSLAGFGQLSLQENDGCTTVNHGELDPMQLEAAERTTAEETEVADKARRQKKAEEMAAAKRYAVEQEQLRQEQLRQEKKRQYAVELEQLRQQKEEKLAAEQYAAEQKQLRQQQEQLQQEKEARAAAERYAAEQEQLRQQQEQLQQKKKTRAAAAEQYAAKQKQLRQEQLRQKEKRQYAVKLEQLRQQEKEKLAAEQNAAEQEQLRQEQLRQKEERQYAVELEQLRQQEQLQQKQLRQKQFRQEKKRQYAVELEQLRQQEEEKLAAEQNAAKQEQLRQQQKQLQQEKKTRAAAEQYAAEQEQLRRNAEEAAAEQVKREQIQYQEWLAREAAEPVQLQPREEDKAAVGTAAEKTRTSRLVTQLDFTPFMFSKSEGAHSTIDPASTERATNIMDPSSEVESRKAVERTIGSTQLKEPVFQTRQGKLQKPEDILEALERDVSSQRTARKTAAEQSLKMNKRLQDSQPDSHLQEAFRLKDVSTGARTVTIIFKAREKGKWIDTYKMTINPSEPSDRSMVERMAKKDARNRQATFYDKNLKLITPAQCLDTAIKDEINIIFMAFSRVLNVDEEMMTSVSQDTNSQHGHKLAVFGPTRFMDRDL
ncbi:hypothetical protein AJ78_03704 [Emergomyces pasteurianus Ep9510]|uniref:Uncharacterized protein n=1 Tax=Emergomyces pasteurianus Ep9510 TaxID=1447872 RepID=A0A1J9QJQ0_9EURO|nr:hypothetical protein AJ78_03704 [Emergomyces pasteurianus Ep9510]